MKILVSGAGIAGLACALDLGTRGHDVTVVEYAHRLRLTGTPIDIRGDAVETVARMGLLAKIREQRIRMSELMQFVDSDGEPVARIPMAEVSDSDDDIEIVRADLVHILADALPATATIRFSDSIDSLTDDGDGVDVELRSGHRERYDLVLGADGQHSAVRRLVFGPERDYLRHLGVYIALAALPDEAWPDRVSSMYNVPARMAGIARYKDKALATFTFRSEPLDYDHHDLDAQKKILTDAFAGHTTWKIPQLLDAARTDPEFFFDSASQIHMPSWHRGRVALVGDAGYCAAFLSGRGTSLALTGAHLLAEELQRCGTDHTEAFHRYEARQRPYVTFAQERVGQGRDRLIPPTQEAIDARNERLRTAGSQHAEPPTARPPGRASPAARTGENSS
ncbi:FAD-dependent monooxygenase [Pseudonocardia parietis]|uniref:2-polyprenyl-6-methoxyphenol hydroxylase-like FAD-dependent oxidoreductase n=1 Tax=Pseudonocardia parietis TaxID=570936 RepID=A0ABS4VTZ3_9PSEU|nr:FAD-dependent monooxygenase [Pseudonocardia parietis]MBP2367395.1 2-polyprenyl-6-methoxyphenol hydroxylase-like FAD-dependent oxidoreductase [Pseudonocardia parietis]